MLLGRIAERHPGTRSFLVASGLLPAWAHLSLALAAEVRGEDPCTLLEAVRRASRGEPAVESFPLPVAGLDTPAVAPAR
jgi:hypothetical protein